MKFFKVMDVDAVAIELIKTSERKEKNVKCRNSALKFMTGEWLSTFLETEMIPLEKKHARRHEDRQSISLNSSLSEDSYTSIEQKVG